MAEIRSGRDTGTLNSGRSTSGPSDLRFRRGWTLVELMVAIAIIGVLLAYMVPHLVSHSINLARITATRQQMEEIKKALVGDPSLVVDGQLASPGYVNDVGAWPIPAPQDTTGLTWLWLQPPGVPSYNPYTQHGWNGPYIRADSSLTYLDDSWGNSYLYVLDSTGKKIGLRSLGPDGFLNTPDDIIVYF